VRLCVRERVCENVCERCVCFLRDWQRSRVRGKCVCVCVCVCVFRREREREREKEREHVEGSEEGERGREGGR